MRKVSQSILVRQDIANLVGHRHSDIYQEINGSEFPGGIQPRLVISSIDPEFQGRAMAEMQLIDALGFPIFYSEPRSQLPEQWVVQPEGIDDTFVITIQQDN